MPVLFCGWRLTGCCGTRWKCWVGFTAWAPAAGCCGTGATVVTWRAGAPGGGCPPGSEPPAPSAGAARSTPSATAAAARRGFLVARMSADHDELERGVDESPGRVARGREDRVGVS